MHNPGYWGTRPTPEIIDSLKPGSDAPLTVFPDGVIADGNTRVRILKDRGIDIDTLPREIRERIKYFDMD